MSNPEFNHREELDFIDELHSKLKVYPKELGIDEWANVFVDHEQNFNPLFPEVKLNLLYLKIVDVGDLSLFLVNTDTEIDTDSLAVLLQNRIIRDRMENLDELKSRFGELTRVAVLGDELKPRGEFPYSIELGLDGDVIFRNGFVLNEEEGLYLPNAPFNNWIEIGGPKSSEDLDFEEGEFRFDQPTCLYLLKDSGFLDRVQLRIVRTDKSDKGGTVE